MKSTTELRKMSAEELQDELLNLRKEQLQLRMKKASGSLDKTHVIKLVRRKLAVVKTIMTEKAGN